MKHLDIVTGDASLFDRIEPLWQELNAYHASISPYFSKAFKEFTFEVRKKSLTSGAESGHLLVEIAVDSHINVDIAYCVTTINSSNKGELESIFILPEFRNFGIGDSLMTRAMEWLDKMSVSEKTVAVVYGNEKVFTFYAKYGFLPRITILRQIDE